MHLSAFYIYKYLQNVHLTWIEELKIDNFMVSLHYQYDINL